ncbi:MAG: hypothetical protein E7440_03315 [Ruminococcaceae bacterium]|nr:hypothetical protein [Oscillospiraceae bacterium]
MRQDADRARAKELLRQMSRKEKINYIFHYYWLHMLVGVFALIVAVVFTVTWRANAATRDYLYIGIQTDCYELLRPKVEELAQQAEWPEELNFLTFPSAASEDGMGSMQLAMYLAADELDFIVCDEYTMRLLTSDETINCSAATFEDTYLGSGTDVKQSMYILALNDTARAEKVEQFMPVMLGPVS